MIPYYNIFLKVCELIFIKKLFFLNFVKNYKKSVAYLLKKGYNDSRMTDNCEVCYENCIH